MKNLRKLNVNCDLKNIHLDMKLLLTSLPVIESLNVWSVWIKCMDFLAELSKNTSLVQLFIKVGFEVDDDKANRNFMGYRDFE